MKDLNKTGEIICRYSPTFSFKDKLKILFGYKLHYICEFILDREVEINSSRSTYKIIKNNE